MTDMTIARNGLYDALNKLFSINYTCLRVSSQETPPEAKTYYRNDIFNQSSGDRWVSAKLRDVSFNRNSLISGLVDAITEQGQNIEIIENELQKAKNALLMVYNIWYEQDKKFNDVFDGYVCKDKDFSEMIHFFETHESFYTEEEALIKICQIYMDYIEIYTKYSTLKTFKDISEELYDDFNDYGRKNIYKKNNPNVILIDKGRIEELASEASKLLKDVENQADPINKKALALQRKLKNKKLSDSDRATFEQEHAVEILKLQNLNIMYNIASEFVEFVGLLKKRLEAANSDVNPTLLGTMTENFMDLITGATKVSKPQITSVYVHKNELNYIEYLQFLLKEFAAPVKEKTTDTKSFE